MVWEKVKDEKDDVQFWNQKDGKPSLVVEVWNWDKNLWRASVNNSWLAKDVSKAKAFLEAKKYMKRVS
jgi:phage-related protein